MRKRKPGPKPKPRREVRRHNVLVKFNDDEWARLKALAVKSPLAPFVRRLVLDAA